MASSSKWRLYGCTKSLSSGSVDQTDMIASAGVSYDSMLSLIRNGNAYVNIHTVARPAGEVRGQIVRD
mgnify:CR=1 FL=1